MTGQKSSDGIGTFENLQALRGVAALLVLYAHVRVLINGVYAPVAITPTGAIGVDLFFVISGFVISLAANKRHYSALDFILARVARVAPLYLSVTLCHTLFHLVAPSLSQSVPGFKSFWNGVFYLPIFDWDDYTPPPIFPGWSLSLEMWFYVAFSFCLVFWKPVRAAAVLPLLFALGAFAGIWYTGHWYLPRFVLHPFAIEFAFGCVVYELRHRIRGALPWILLLLAAIYFYVISQHYLYVGDAMIALSSPHHAWLRVMVWGVPMALLVAGMLGLELTRTYVMPRPLAWFGNISYSLYILHWPILQMLSNVATHLNIHSPWIAGIVGTVTCVLAATLCYYFVELPLTSRAQKLAKRLSSSGTPPASVATKAWPRAK